MICFIAPSVLVGTIDGVDIIIDIIMPMATIMSRFVVRPAER